MLGERPTREERTYDPLLLLGEATKVTAVRNAICRWNTVHCPGMPLGASSDANSAHGTVRSTSLQMNAGSCGARETHGRGELSAARTQPRHSCKLWRI